MIWIAEIKFDIDDKIQSEKNADNSFREFTCKALSIDKMTRKALIEHIQLTDVPNAYYTTIKSRKPDNSLEFHNNLLQVTIGTNGMIFDLDSPHLEEVTSIENIDMISDPDECTNTGFIMSLSHKARNRDDVDYLKRVQIFTNEHCNMLFQKEQSRFKLQTEKEKFTKYHIKYKISGMLYRTFSELDLFELLRIQKSAANHLTINYIDPEAILANYEGHTIFSIFFDRIEVFDQIYDQIDSEDYPSKLDVNGFKVENSYLRRLHRVLNLPTTDLLHYKVRRSGGLSGERKHDKILNEAKRTKKNQCF